MKSRPGTPSLIQLGLVEPPALPRLTERGIRPILGLLLLSWLAFPAAFSAALAWFTLQALMDHPGFQPLP